MIRHLWLDLEDTVITPVMEGWFKTEMINTEKVRDFITEFKPDYVHLFSFAIWNQQELSGFNTGTRPMLEAALNIKLSQTPTVDDNIVPSCCRLLGIDPGSITFSDMSDFWGKQGAFRLYMRHMFKTTHSHGIDSEVVLLDDAVFDEEFYWPDIRLRGRVLNIDQLVCRKTTTNSFGPR